MKTSVDHRRIRKINNKSYSAGSVVYWMSRDQRIYDNWTLIYAQELAFRLKVPLFVVFCVAPKFLDATARQFDFMLKGLRFVEKSAVELNIPFVITSGDPTHKIPIFLKSSKAGALITDFSPLKIKQSWNNIINKKISIPFYEVDAHNIIPCWFLTEKQEYAAYTIRPKINRVIDDFLIEFPKIHKQKIDCQTFHEQINWQKIEKTPVVDKSVKPVSWLKPGTKEALNTLKHFIKFRLIEYDSSRNDPNRKAQSDLSPYLHFGQISAQRVALEIRKSKRNKKSGMSFLEELIVRRELSDNFCYYNNDYDSMLCFPSWAKKSLGKHMKDKREYLYSVTQFEKAETHDELWNAAQTEMLLTGKMHGYMRMYWAKKILEWSQSPEIALKTAIYLNDKYGLDGRDPNGYAGIAWSIGGVHDRAWPERKVFGQIRYMNYDGCRRKFDVDKYIMTIRDLFKTNNTK